MLRESQSEKSTNTVATGERNGMENTRTSITTGQTSYKYKTERSILSNSAVL
jgi:hypothetical protein